MRHDPVSVLQTTATNAYAADVGQAAQTYADANAAWVDAESHAYAAYEQDLAAARVALVSAIAPANVTYAHDAAQAWADYHVSMTGIQQDTYTAWAQLNVAQVNAADPSTFAYIYPQYGGSWAPMMLGGVSALSWAYFEAPSFISTLGMPEYTPPPNLPTASSALSLNGATSPATPSGFWNSVGNSLWSIWRGGVGAWQWGRSWFDGNVDYITTCQTAYDYGPLGQTQNSSGMYYWGTRGALALSSIGMAAAVAVGTTELVFLENTSILVEGVLVGGRMGSGGLFQIRPSGNAPWLRIDLHPITPGGSTTLHVDSPPLGWHHWPWQ